MLQMNMFRGLDSVAVRVLLSHDVRAACSSVMMIIIMGRERSSGLGPWFGVAQLMAASEVGIRLRHLTWEQPAHELLV